MVFVVIIAFLLSLVLGKLMLPLLRKLKIGQVVRDDGPKEHLKKAGTPTMGGLIFTIPVIACALYFTKCDMLTVVTCIVIFLSCAIGFTDDLLKIKRHNKEGLKPILKTVCFITVSAAYAIYAVYFTEIGSDIVIPFTGSLQTFHLPEWIYVLFIVFFYNAVVNAVNFTDGVDGLCGSVTCVVAVFFALVSHVIFKNDDMTYIALALCGSLLAYLIYNVHPAKVMMGDTGSLALGGTVTLISINLRIPWIILIAGIIYVIEILSSVIQVLHYKRTKKRVFLMAPIHHHFELKHWSENKIVLIFTAVSLAGGIAAYFML
jgi:phospho-N-acetylmuramoyl-pentapeptide-transferase